jgi:hypothetical protein
VGKINPALEPLYKVVLDNPGKYTVKELSILSGLTQDTISGALRRGKDRGLNLQVKAEAHGPKPTKVTKPVRREYIPPPPNTENVMVIGDLHEPFTLEGYREFCYEQYKRYKITHVIFIGDIIDGHAWSFHEHDPDGMSAGEELHFAKEHIAQWAKAFPIADVIWGNHDLLFMRKAFSSGLPREMIMSFQDAFGTPGWHFTERAQYDDVQYIHGLGGTARLRCKKDLMSTVQGHMHPQAYTEWFVGQHYRIFSMQVGCGVDRHSYAMAYAKDHPKPAIGVGIILQHGQLAFNVLMKL